MHAIQTSGNCIRNITSDPLAGAAHDEIGNLLGWCEIIRQWSTLHPEFAFLPRKFKIAVSAGTEDRAATGFHDIGLRLIKNSAGELGFRVLLGGGQGRTPRVAQIISAFSDAVDAEWVRIKDSAIDLPETEKNRIMAQFARPPLPRVSEAASTTRKCRRDDAGFDRWLANNTHPHWHDGYASASISLKQLGCPPGDAAAAEMIAMADLADQFGRGELRVTYSQNIIIPHIPRHQLVAFYDALRTAGLAGAKNGLISDMIACPRLDYCNLANTRSLPLADTLFTRFGSPEMGQDIGALRLNISGCINACGYHHAGYIGILGVNKKGAEHFQISLVGRAGEDAAVGCILGPSLAEDEVPDVIAALIEIYSANRKAGESFAVSLAQLGTEAFKVALHGRS